MNPRLAGSRHQRRNEDNCAPDSRAMDEEPDEKGCTHSTNSHGASRRSSQSAR